MNANLYYLALMSALAVPDIAGALSAENGRANDKKYADWYNQWARPRLKESRDRDNPFTGEECYRFRCALLHQGKTEQAEKPRKENRIYRANPSKLLDSLLRGSRRLVFDSDRSVRRRDSARRRVVA